MQSYEEEDKPEVYFTDRQYRRGGSSSRPSRPFDKSGNTSTQGIALSRRKKYFVSGKDGCRSSRYSQQERDDFKWQFEDRHPEWRSRQGYNHRLQQYIVDYEGNEDDTDEAAAAQFFEELLIDTKLLSALMPDINSSESFFTSFGKLHDTELLITTNLTNKANIIHWSSAKFKWVTRSIIAAELYEMAHGFNNRGSYQDHT
ncbi:hypothetical protein MMC29_002889 [Sticta canariensis]|nr:hypothetical protein [Sticta canariensis]